MAGAFGGNLHFFLCVKLFCPSIAVDVVSCIVMDIAITVTFNFFLHILFVVYLLCVVQPPGH